jgi:hypothetical protein
MEETAMMLYETMMDDACVLMEKVRVPDGLGGWTTQWTDGAAFNAAILKDASTVAKIAEKDGVTELYTVTVKRETPLDFHDVFRRTSDGQIFRVTSNMTDNVSPSFSKINFGQVTAERWVLE